MVDLGQKGWKKFRLFYWNKVKASKTQIRTKDVMRS